jgi:hypothetical protein
MAVGIALEMTASPAAINEGLAAIAHADSRGSYAWVTKPAKCLGAFFYHLLTVYM